MFFGCVRVWFQQDGRKGHFVIIIGKNGSEGVSLYYKSNKIIFY